MLISYIYIIIIYNYIYIYVHSKLEIVAVDGRW